MTTMCGIMRGGGERGEKGVSNVALVKEFTQIWFL